MKRKRLKWISLIQAGILLSAMLIAMAGVCPAN